MVLCHGAAVGQAIRRHARAAFACVYETKDARSAYIHVGFASHAEQCAFLAAAGSDDGLAALASCVADACGGDVCAAGITVKAALSTRDNTDDSKVRSHTTCAAGVRSSRH
jgi:hypothetical protein